MMTSPIFLGNNWRRLAAFALAALTLSLSAPSLAHDPLRDDHHDDHVVEPDTAAGVRTDLAAVRSLVLSFRETGDDQRLDEAWDLLKPAIEFESPNPQTLVTAAFVAQSRHDFAYAEQLLRESLTSNNHNDEAWLLLASIYLVQGDAESAGTACGQLRTVAPLILLTCKARVALASGHHELALTRLQGVLSAVDTQDVPVEVLAWSYSVAGDLAVANSMSRLADDLYRQSLDLAERTQVRAALVDVLLSEANYDSAWQALDAGALALPLLVRRLIVAKRLHRLQDLKPVNEKVQHEFDTWIANEDWLHAREMTRYFIDVVDRPDLARRLALINVGLQREPEDLRLERRTRL